MTETTTQRDASVSEGAGAAKQPAATSAEVVRLVGDLDAAVIAAILRSGASYRDIEEAAQYAAGTDEALGKERLELGPAAQAVYDILTRDPEFLGTGPDD